MPHKLTILKRHSILIKAERAEFERNPLGFNIDGVEKQTVNTEINTSDKTDLTHTDVTSPLTRPLYRLKSLTEKQHLAAM